MDRLEYIVNRLPQFYNTDTPTSKIRAIINTIADELDITDGYIDRIMGLNGIDKTIGIDLDIRWGKLLGLPRSSDESDALYRNRLKTSISGMAGGTISSLEYAIAVALGINNNPVAMRDRIRVVDAWLYDGTVPVITDHGYVVCVVDLDSQIFSEYTQNINDVIYDAIVFNKAAGINVQLVLTNYRMMTYLSLSGLQYINMAGLKYNQLGDVV